MFQHTINSIRYHLISLNLVPDTKKLKNCLFIFVIYCVVWPYNLCERADLQKNFCLSKINMKF